MDGPRSPRRHRTPSRTAGRAPDNTCRDARERMVEYQLIARGIRDPYVLAAMRTVPREAFVPTAQAAAAYDDAPLPIGEEQTISQPYIVAYMLEALELASGERVLDIGTGSGYAAALLAEMGCTVVSIERLAGLAAAASARLHALGYDAVRVVVGDGSAGWAAGAPWDAIVAAAGAPRVPAQLREQLAVGGRLLLPIGDQRNLQALERIRRESAHGFVSERLLDVRFVPLVGTAGW
ncbi:MAG: protein-L-isoaspartate(D-aspartate) O-methyltransferase [Gammaproteobacteria bacterium]